MLRRPPGLTRTAHPFPSTTLCRSLNDGRSFTAFLVREARPKRLAARLARAARTLGSALEGAGGVTGRARATVVRAIALAAIVAGLLARGAVDHLERHVGDRKSTRLNSRH